MGRDPGEVHIHGHDYFYGWKRPSAPPAGSLMGQRDDVSAPAEINLCVSRNRVFPVAHQLKKKICLRGRSYRR